MKSRVEDDRVLVLERVFDAPRALVFEMYSQAEHLQHWWGPGAGSFRCARWTFARVAFGTTA